MRTSPPTRALDWALHSEPSNNVDNCPVVSDTVLATETGQTKPAFQPLMNSHIPTPLCQRILINPPPCPLEAEGVNRTRERIITPSVCYTSMASVNADLTLTHLGIGSATWN